MGTPGGKRVLGCVCTSLAHRGPHPRPGCGTALHPGVQQCARRSQTLGGRWGVDVGHGGRCSDLEKKGQEGWGVVRGRVSFPMGFGQVPLPSDC